MQINIFIDFLKNISYMDILKSMHEYKRTYILATLLTLIHALTSKFSLYSTDGREGTWIVPFMTSVVI